MLDVIDPVSDIAYDIQHYMVLNVLLFYFFICKFVFEKHNWVVYKCN